jgi:hypothetical protein
MIAIPHNSEKGNKAALKNCVHEFNINNQQLQDSSVDARYNHYKCDRPYFGSDRFFFSSH